MTRAHVPDRGDVIWLDLTPRAGHEQAGRRPVLALSPPACNKKSGWMLCCPVTNQAKGYQVSVTPSTGKITGVALADQVRCLDWHSRNASKFAAVTTQRALDVSAKVKLLLP